MKAFPVVVPDVDENYSIQSGMDLRDYFAIRIMQSYLNHKEVQAEIGFKTNPTQLSKCAYEIADAMIKVRNNHE
jgi:hypothetical protein